MSSDQVGKLDAVAEEMEDLDSEDLMGWEGDGAEIQECGVGHLGPLDRGSGSTTPNDGGNVSGCLRLPQPRSESLNQPSGNTPP